MKKQSFWQTLKKPLVGLAPMDGVTDLPFRQIQKKYGQPDIMFTEFVSVEGLCHKACILLDHLLYDEQQRPIIAQIFGKTPEYFRQVAILVCQLGFDGIDINMGCPAKNVTNHGSGAGLIQTPELAQEIVRAVKLGIEEYQNGSSTKDCANFSSEIVSEVQLRQKQLPQQFQNRSRYIPVSIKTRLGYSSSIINEWLSVLLETKPDAITIHGRTLKQGYSGKADWEEIAKAAKFARTAQATQTQPRSLIVGNGDIQSRKQAEEYAKNYGLDGILIGRASFGNPYVFKKNMIETSPSLPQIALEHAQVFEKTFSKKPKYSFLPIRKHLGWYIKSMSNAKEVRLALVRCISSEEVRTVLEQHNLI